MSLPIGAFLTVWAILALDIASPGPNVLNTVTTAMGSGRAAGFASAAAVGLGVGLWCLGMALGMAALFRVVPHAGEALTFLAAGLLVWFAVRYVRAAVSVPYRAAALRARGGLTPSASFLRSLSINATNPRALTTWLAILGIFPTAAAGAGDLAVLTAGACLLSLAIHGLCAAAFSTRAAAALYLRAAPVVNGVVGTFFLGFAAKLAAPLPARAV